MFLAADMTHPTIGIDDILKCDKGAINQPISQPIKIWSYQIFIFLSVLIQICVVVGAIWSFRWNGFSDDGICGELLERYNALESYSSWTVIEERNEKRVIITRVMFEACQRNEDESRWDKSHYAVTAKHDGLFHFFSYVGTTIWKGKIPTSVCQGITFWHFFFLFVHLLVVSACCSQVNRAASTCHQESPWCRKARGRVPGRAPDVPDCHHAWRQDLHRCTRRSLHGRIPHRHVRFHQTG